MLEEEKNRKKLHELSASPLFIRVLVRRTDSKTVPESYCPYNASRHWGGERKGEQHDPKRQEVLSHFRNEDASFSFQKNPSACRSGY